MKKSDAQAVLETAQSLLQNELGEEPLTVEEIETAVDRVLMLNPRWKAAVDRSDIVRNLEARFSVWIGRTLILENNEDHIAWLNAERKTGWRLWPRYRQYLEQEWSPVAVDKLDEATDEIISRLEDPRRPGQWDRRGLVVGHVQSGKTSNYTGLLCKAADAGYKVIIVLAGIHKNLRSQTQMRLDEGFLGYETMPRNDADANKLRSIGVGLIDPDHSIQPDWVTNRSDNGDFKLSFVRHMGISPGGRPMLFVVKKNKTVLTNIIRWVDTVLNGRESLPDVPLLVVDDEADHASVDTREQEFDEFGEPDPEHDPTTINRLIRTLLKRFEQAAYVGYTATPFANIFIHDKGRTREEGDDLFPRSFIMNLPAPSNYDGPVRIFGLDPLDADDQGQPGLPIIRHLQDHAETSNDEETRGWMPPVHNNGHYPLVDGSDDVPASLHEAILAFIIVIAARRARGQVASHNSMLVHVTRFTNVQRVVKAQVERTLASIQRRLRRGESGANSVHQQIKNLWEKDFVPTTAEVEASLQDRTFQPVGWDVLEPLLSLAADDIRVREINGTAKDILDYDIHKATGFNVIAIGGDKLARGLTLEGLSISYFLRASRMYDTLMQMGRWFGYRPGYLDLCRLYTTPDLEDWFCHITEAAEELRREFDHMHAIGGTPKDYGLKVKAHPVLMVTSRVKMRNSTTVDLVFEGDLQETVVFHRGGPALTANYQTTCELVRRIGPPTETSPRRNRSGGGDHEWKGSKFWRGVPGDAIVDFLEAFRTHESAVKVNSRILATYVERQMAAGELTSWDVALMSGDEGSREVKIDSLTARMIVRSANPRISLERQRAENRFVIRRLLSPRDEAIDLNADEYEAALRRTIEDWRPDAARSRRKTEPDSPSGPAIRRVRGQHHPERGLLLLYPLDPEKAELSPESLPIIGFGVSFPTSGKAHPVVYAVNNIYWDQQYGEAA
ncbi:Z1 domain-containing protein [Microvirga sesbaniae]|uniref:Z1 domain-containing protein n=1 Tax=Microvirga sesbaniae TaxID=681392 RepID=UPI0021C8121D|nr:Z1 domain-containing protein [Microvirga sp. HBU67692]